MSFNVLLLNSHIDINYVATSAAIMTLLLSNKNFRCNVYNNEGICVNGVIGVCLGRGKEREDLNEALTKINTVCV